MSNHGRPRGRWPQIVECRLRYLPGWSYPTPPGLVDGCHPTHPTPPTTFGAVGRSMLLISRAVWRFRHRARSASGS